MSLLKGNRPHPAFASLSILLAIAVLVAARFLYTSRLLAAKHAMAAEDARAAAQLATPAVQHPTANPVLVELFTSEGCSDCPPADELLARLQHDQPVASANIITLEEHVDYWDHLGWKDRFSSAYITARQNAYTLRLDLDDNYTPQMIVDGTDQFVGSDSAHALRSITLAARAPKLKLILTSANFTASHAAGSVLVDVQPAQSPRADLYAALVLRASSTDVLHGENGGHTLRHVSTVLALQKLGDTSGTRSFSLNTPQGANPADLAVVVFAQQPGQGAILGAASASPPANH